MPAVNFPRPFFRTTTLPAGDVRFCGSSSVASVLCVTPGEAPCGLYARVHRQAGKIHDVRVDLPIPRSGMNHRAYSWGGLGPGPGREGEEMASPSGGPDWYDDPYSSDPRAER